MVISSLYAEAQTNTVKRAIDSIQAKKHRDLPISINKDCVVKNNGSVTQVKMKTINGVFDANGVVQELIKYKNGSEILETTVWIDGGIMFQWRACKGFGSGIVHLSDLVLYSVPEVTDSVFRAHRECADNFFLKKKYP